MSVVSYKSVLTKANPIRHLLLVSKIIGRNNVGRITVRHQGGDIKDCLEKLILITIK